MRDDYLHCYWIHAKVIEIMIFYIMRQAGALFNRQISSSSRRSRRFYILFLFYWWSTCVRIYIHGVKYQESNTCRLNSQLLSIISYFIISFVPLMKSKKSS